MKNQNNLNSDEARLLDEFRSAPDWKKKKIHRMLTLLQNNSPRMNRLIDLHDHGFISDSQFWVEI